jgi:sulfur-oxidizing protein SoxY
VGWKQIPFRLSIKSLGCDIAVREGAKLLEKNPAPKATRRRVLLAGAAGLATATLIPSADANEENAGASEDAVAVVERLTGKTPIESERVHLVMPRSFPNGYTVPLNLAVDSPMTESNYVRYARVIAPRNPLIEVATFHFVPERSLPKVSTRIRLAEPQFVLAIAELNDGALLMAKAWVEVATNGCA